MSKKPATHGGPRKGSGRKLGSGKGRTAVTRSVSMQPESWDKLDRARGDTPRGKYIESKLFPGGKKYEVAMDFKANKIHLIPL
jgi:hypothetical protein